MKPAMIPLSVVILVQLAVPGAVGAEEAATARLAVAPAPPTAAATAALDAPGTTEASSLGSQIAATRDALQRVLDETAATQAQLAQRREELARLSASSAATAAERTRLRNEIAGLETSAQAASARKNELVAEVGRIGGELVELQRKTAAEAARLEAFRKAVADIENKGAFHVTDLIRVSVDGVESRPLGIDQPRLHDEEGKCRIEVQLTQAQLDQGIGSLKSAGILGLEMASAHDGKILDAGPRAWPIDAPRFVVNREALCDRNRRGLSNQAVLHLRVTFVSAGVTYVAPYEIRYVRPRMQFDLALGTYFAGNGWNNLESATLAVFPALKAGLRFNIPAGDENRDFYLQPNLLVLGGGFAFPTGSQGQAAGTGTGTGAAPSSDKKFQQLTLFSGATVELGRYVEVGYAYDWRNRTSLFVFAPGRVLSASILTR